MRRPAATRTPLSLPLFRSPRRVKGKSMEEVVTIKNSDIAKHLSLPPVKLHCSMLAEVREVAPGPVFPRYSPAPV